MVDAPKPVVRPRILGVGIVIEYDGLHVAGDTIEDAIDELIAGLARRWEQGVPHHLRT